MAKKIRESINRKIPPPIFDVTDIHLPTPSVYALDNGVPLYDMRMGTQAIMRIELVVPSGRLHEHKRLVARTTNRLLREGSQQYTSAQIADAIEFYAGTLQSPVNLDAQHTVLYCMTKHFDHLAPVLADLFFNPVFKPEELQTYVQNNLQSLAVDLTKNDVVAYRQITEWMFGANHPYGYNSTPDDYRALSPDDCHQYHQAQFTTDNLIVFLSGQTTDETIKTVNRYFGQHKTQRTSVVLDMPAVETLPRRQFIENGDAPQRAIRIGRRIGNRKQPDFNALYVLTTVLGGYFGSRLMRNIREEKGYTYGIYASIDTMLHDGYLSISAEVGQNVTNAALKEIYKEIAILQNELIPDDELKMVRNYLMGNLLTTIDGPFAINDVVKMLVIEQTPLSAFDAFVHTIQHITPQALRDLAQKYLRPEDLFEVVVGSK